MNNVKIGEIFQHDISRKINGVVKADQNEKDIVVTELEEYVITSELRKHFQKFFDRYVGSLNKNTEDMGVWISGFYGSGKSHFLKMIGRILENKEYDGKRVIDFFKEKIKDDFLLMGNIEKSSQVPTDVILFNVDNVSDQDTYQNKDSIAVAFMKNFNGYFGFSKDNLKIAEFERKVWEDGKFEKFKEAFEESTGNTWEDGKRNIDFYDQEFIDVVQELEIMSADGANRWLERDDKIPVSPEVFADSLEHYLKQKDKNHRIVFLVDEIGQYIGDNSQLMLNLQTLVEVLGMRFQGRVWVIVTSQQDLGNIIHGGEHRRNDFSKIQDRFKTMLSLSSGNIDEVIKKRLLEKRSVDKEDLEKFYDKNHINISNLISFDKSGMTLPLYSGRGDFSETYPFVGYQFSLLQKVFEKVRDMGFSGQHMSRGERSLLSSFQEASIRIKESEVGALVPFNYFFESIEQFLEDIAKRPFEHAKNEKGVNDFELEVLKLLFLLKGINGIESNINNIVSFMIDSVDCDRIELEKNIKKALLKLEKEVLIQKDGDCYYFLTNEEQDITKEISKEQYEEIEVYKQLDNYIFQDIYNKNYINGDSNSKDRKYTFTRIIDGNVMGKRGEQLVINIITPLFENYENLLMLNSRGAEYNLMIKLPLEVNVFIDEIRQYIQVESFVKRKSIETTREIITQILRTKQKENINRYNRIKAGIEEALLDADVYILGQKISLGSINDAKKIIEESLKKEASNIFRFADLIKKPYDEKQIKNVLSYEFDKNLTLIQVEKDIESNINKEALQEVRRKLDNDTKRGIITTLKSLVDYFEKAPYGWDNFSTAGLVAELWVYRIIEIEESKEKIRDRETIKDLLTKSQSRNLERVVITLREEIDIELIKKVNNIIKEKFGVTYEISTDDPKNRLANLLTNKRKDAENCVKRCREEKYPGIDLLKDWIDLLDDLISYKEKTTEKFLEYFISNRDEFADEYEKQAIVEDFFVSNKKEKFDSAREIIDNIEKNSGYLKDLKNSEAYKKIVEILESKKPFSRIRELDSLISQLETEKDNIVKEEIKVLKEEAYKIREKLKNILVKREALLEKLETLIDNYLEKIQNIKNIERVMSEKKELENIEENIENLYRKSIKDEIESIEKSTLKSLDDKRDSEELEQEIKNYYNRLSQEASNKSINELEQIILIAIKDKEQFILQASGKAKKKERVQLNRIKIEQKYNIENEKEVEEYINKLEKELEKLKATMLDAVKENKIIDIK